MPPFSFVSGRLLPTPTLSRLFPGMAAGSGSLVSFPRRLVVLAFFFDTSSRIYALYEDIHRPFQGSYAPHIYAMILAFALGAILEAWWIRNLGRPASNQQATDEEGGVFVNNEKPQATDPTKQRVITQSLSEEVTTTEFIPLYIVGSLCQGSWAMSWVSHNNSMCRLFLTISAVTQLYAIFALLNGSKNRGLPKRNRSIHLIAKSRAALAMMLLWKTWGTVDAVPPPTPTQQVNNLSFLLIFAMSSGPDPTMGLCLTYVLFSLTLGPYTPAYTLPTPPLTLPEPSSRAKAILRQVKAHIPIGIQNGGWHDTFGWSALVVLFVVAIDWSITQHARNRRGAVRLASQSEMFDHFVLNTPKGLQTPQARAPPVCSDSDEEEEEEEGWLVGEYQDGEEYDEYEMEGDIQMREEEQGRARSMEERVLPADYDPFTLKRSSRESEPSFVLVVDPPTPHRGKRPATECESSFSER